jgi:hypothetical protein
LDNNTDNIQEDTPDNNLDEKKAVPKKLRCINIDCVFNSSNAPEQPRNFCNHPNLNIESKFADITIAICSEFRSKKDYEFKPPLELIELKTNTHIEIKVVPEPSFTRIEKVTTKELEEGVKGKTKRSKLKTPAPEIIPEKPPKVEYETPVVISSEEGKVMPAEPYSGGTVRHTELQQLKKLYQPYLKKGITFSIIIHIVLIFLIYSFLVEKKDKVDASQQQRIVVVEDIETPKFDPPDVDKQKEIDKRETETSDKDALPEIKPKNIVPKIKRPKTETPLDTTSISLNNKVTDSLKAVTDSLLLAMGKGDTNRLLLPDSLKNFMPDNEIGLKLWYPRNWKLTDNRSVNLKMEEFKGVIINTDSASEDPGAVSIFIQIDDPKYSSYNKTTFKNIFQMDDSLSTAYSTDPLLTGAKRINYKFFIFTDPTGKNNIYVNTETKKEFFEKYRKYIEAVVRSVKIVPKTPSGETKK